MYEVRFTNQFKHAVKRCAKRGLDVLKIAVIVDILKAKGGRCLKNTVLTNFQVLKATTRGNAISNLIGCSFGNKTTPNSPC